MWARPLLHRDQLPAVQHARGDDRALDHLLVSHHRVSHRTPYHPHAAPEDAVRDGALGDVAPGLDGDVGPHGGIVYRDAVLDVHRGHDRTAGARPLGDPAPALLEPGPVGLEQWVPLAAFVPAS